MKIIILPRVLYQDTINTKTYKEIYFGNLISTTADSETIDEWVSTKTDYAYLDEVYISNLHTKYTATINNPVGHPSTSSGWFAEGTNINRMLDSLYTSQSVFSDTCEVEYNIINMTHIIAQNVENVKEVQMIFYRNDGTEISTVFDCDACIEPETKIVMAYYESFDCDTCCNPEAINKNSFYYRFNPLSCSNVAKVKVIMTKQEETLPISVGVMAVGRAYSLGCSLEGMSLELSIPVSNVTFPAIAQTGIAPANIETYIRGKTLIERSKVDQLRQLMSKHGAFLNFYVFDELDDITSGIVLGRFTQFSTTLSTANKVELPVEIVGIQN